MWCSLYSLCSESELSNPVSGQTRLINPRILASFCRKCQSKIAVRDCAMLGINHIISNTSGMPGAKTTMVDFMLLNALKDLKRRRGFEGLDKDADIKFLTKDIPTSFIQYMAAKLKEEIQKIHFESQLPSKEEQIKWFEKMRQRSKERKKIINNL